MKSKSIILLAVSLGFGLVAAFGISQVLGRGSEEAEVPPQKKVEVLIAKTTIDQWSEFSEENVEVKEWPEEMVPEAAMTSMEELKNMVARSRIPAKSPILMDHSVPKEDSKKIEIRPGHKVVAINVDKEDTIGGLLEAGHRVDLMAVFHNKRSNGVFAKTFLRNVRVYAIDSRTDVSEDVGASAAATVISLEVTKRQAEKILLVQRVATLKIALVGTKPVESAEGDLPNDVTDMSMVLDNAPDGAPETMPQVTQPAQPTTPPPALAQPSPSKFSLPIKNFFGSDDSKKMQMVILGQSGTQTYTWKEGEVPTLQRKVPAGPPVPEFPGSPVSEGNPLVKDAEQEKSESDSGSKGRIPEDEFDE